MRQTSFIDSLLKWIGYSKGPFTTHTIRLKPGMDLKRELENTAKLLGLQAAAIVTTVGSLEKVNLRFADQKQPTPFNGYHEILSLNGTLSQSGMHIHLTVADKDGQVKGGHLTEGNIIYTTAEIVILEQNHLSFSRVIDPTYGHGELEIQSRSW